MMECPIVILPNDIFRLIFSNLGGKDRANICTVHSTWGKLSRDVTLAIVPQDDKYRQYRDYHLFSLLKPKMDIRLVCRGGNFELFKQIYNKGFWPGDDWIIAAGKSGCIDILETLLNSNKMIDPGIIIKIAYAGGRRNHTEVILKCLKYRELSGATKKNISTCDCVQSHL